MRTLAVWAGVHPVFAALSALLLVLCVGWQGRHASSVDTDSSPEWFGASPSSGESQITAVWRARERENITDVAADEGRHAIAPASGARPASFAQRFAAAFAYLEQDDEADAPGGPAAAVPAAGELGAAPGTDALPTLRDPNGVLSLEPDGYEGRTAIYDIRAHAVYLPNGDRLEAHSGLGSLLDNPRHVSMRNRGPTPPNVYDLVLRKGRFHGVRAIRLIPVDQGRMFGRGGMLAHSYMLGPNGQSNGCVVFRDYPAFLNAFLRGDVQRLVVVDNLATASRSTSGAGPDPLRKLAQRLAATRY